MWQEIDQVIADDFVHKFGQSEFLQSSIWLSAQQQFYSVNRLGYYDKSQLLAVATLIRRPLLGRYCYYYSPRGPIVSDYVRNNQKYWSVIINELNQWLSSKKVLFWRLEPGSDFNNFDFLSIGLKSSRDIQPSQSRILDITCSEAEILAQMHHKTRYNIRLASKRGVVIESGLAGFNDFWQLMLCTGQRDGFHLHSQQYYRAIAQLPNVKLLVAKYDNELVAAGLFVYWGKTAVYLHGASSNQRRELMAPYLIQWQAIKLARQQGCQRYDLFGIDQVKWPGVTRFKQGFGGEIINFPGTFDWPVSNLAYYLYRFLRLLRRLLR